MINLTDLAYVRLGTRPIRIRIRIRICAPARLPARARTSEPPVHACRCARCCSQCGSRAWAWARAVLVFRTALSEPVPAPLEPVEPV